MELAETGYIYINEEERANYSDARHQIRTPVIRRVLILSSCSSTNMEDSIERSKKERNTQRRKRRQGLEKKAYFLAKLCGFDVALLIYNPEQKIYHTFRSSDKKWPSVESIV